MSPAPLSCHRTQSTGTPRLPAGPPRPVSLRTSAGTAQRRCRNCLWVAFVFRLLMAACNTHHSSVRATSMISSVVLPESGKGPASVEPAIAGVAGGASLSLEWQDLEPLLLLLLLGIVIVIITPTILFLLRYLTTCTAHFPAPPLTYARPRHPSRRRAGACPSPNH